MRLVILAVLVVCVFAFVFAATLRAADSPEGTSGRPQYTTDNQLLPPSDYREWVFLSSGFGMTYNTATDHEMFSNVFVPQWVYREFLKSGKWPEKTMFVVEERGASSKGSINKGGHYQSDDFMGIGVEVKDSAHFTDKWAYFNFDDGTKSAAANPKTGCWTCHENHASVEHVFVQFYPTLKPVAKKFGTYREAAENVQ